MGSLTEAPSYLTDQHQVYTDPDFPAKPGHLPAAFRGGLFKKTEVGKTGCPQFQTVGDICSIADNANAKTSPGPFNIKITFSFRRLEIARQLFGHDGSGWEFVQRLLDDSERLIHFLHADIIPARESHSLNTGCQRRAMGRSNRVIFPDIVVDSRSAEHWTSGAILSAEFRRNHANAPDPFSENDIVRHQPAEQGETFSHSGNECAATGNKSIIDIVCKPHRNGNSSVSSEPRRLIPVDPK